MSSTSGSLCHLPCQGWRARRRLRHGCSIDVLNGESSDLLYLVKPVCTSLITSFLKQSLSASDRTAAVAARWSRRHDLSLAEQDILLRSALGETQDEIAATRGTSTLTVKKQTVSILEKTGHRSLQLAAAALLREGAGL
jgi:DNA-binding CsgD family transcriptional regulator